MLSSVSIKHLFSQCKTVRESDGGNITRLSFSREKDRLILRVSWEAQEGNRYYRGRSRSKGDWSDTLEEARRPILGTGRHFKPGKATHSTAYEGGVFVFLRVYLSNSASLTLSEASAENASYASRSSSGTVAHRLFVLFLRQIDSSTTLRWQSPFLCKISYSEL